MIIYYLFLVLGIILSGNSALAYSTMGDCSVVNAKAGLTVTGTCRQATSVADLNSAVGVSSSGSGGLSSDGKTFNGDAAYLPHGDYSNGTVSWSNKNVLVIGDGNGTCSPSSESAGCSCDSASNTCISASGTVFDVTFPNPTYSHWRVSGFYISSTANDIVFQIGSLNDFDLITSSAAYGFRIDHNTFNYPNAFQEGLIQVVGPVFGLIDNNNIVGDGEASICTFLFYPNESSYLGDCGANLNDLCGAESYRLIPYSPGDVTKNLTIESNMLWVSTGGITFFDTYYNGARLIFRYNSIWNGLLYSHWTGAGNINAIWFEINNNTFRGPYYPMRFQGGGTGLIYNNTVLSSDPTFHLGEDRSNDSLGHGTPDPLSSCNGSRSVDGNVSGESGWPCLAQAGRGNPGIDLRSGSPSPAVPSYPIYLWNNGTQAACAACTDQSSASCSGCTNSATINSEAPNYIKATAHSNGDVDWSKTAVQPNGAGTHTLTYTAATYPHPLQGEGEADTTAPTSFSGQISSGVQIR